VKGQRDKTLVISPLYGVPDTVLTRPSVPGQDIVFLLRDSFCVGGVKPQPCECWTPTRMCDVTTALHGLYGLDRLCYRICIALNYWGRHKRKMVIRGIKLTGKQPAAIDLTRRDHYRRHC